MEFYDCRLRYGILINERPYTVCETVSALIGAMRRAGLAGGLVYNYAADGLACVTGNEMLRKDLRAVKNESPEVALYGAYTVLPSVTGETVPPDELPGYMKENGFGAIRFNPSAHRFLASPYVLGDYLETACEKKIPVMLDAGSVGHDAGMTLETADGYLRDFPELTALLYYDNVWPNDRYIRPLLKRYRNLHMNTVNFVADGQYEEVAAAFGDGRLLHGSSYPELYMACGVLSILHAEIPEESKKRIAGENFLRLVGGWSA